MAHAAADHVFHPQAPPAEIPQAGAANLGGPPGFAKETWLGKSEETTEPLTQLEDASTKLSEHGGTPGKTSATKNRGKTEATLELLRSLPNVPAEWSDSGSSEETISLPSPRSWAEDNSEAEEEPPRKKGRTEPIKGEKRKAENKTSLLGGFWHSEDPSTSSDGLEDDFAVELPPSLLDLYFNDTLEAAQESSFADWLLDPDKEFPRSPEPPEEDEGPLPAQSPLTDVFPSIESLMLMVEEAAAVVTGQWQWQYEEAAGTSSRNASNSSTEQYAEGAASPLLKAEPALEEEPSTGAASASKSPHSSRSLEDHPFYRRPDIPSGTVDLPVVDFVSAFGGQPGGSLGTLLEPVRIIMAKTQLSHSDILELQRLGVSLMAYAGLRMMKPVKKSQHSALVQPLTQRLLLAHYLLAVCDLVGPAMQRENWWYLYMQRVLEHPPNWEPLPEERAKQVGRARPALVKMIVEAMAILRRGQRVPPQLIVPIMQQVFCTDFTIKYFSRSEWAGWRQAEADFFDENSSSGTTGEDQ
ncbi:hypothetical protein Emag_006231 [Eimeria magna]